MISLEECVERVISKATSLKKVGLAADIPNAKKELKQTPSAYFILGAEKGGKNTLAMAVDQTITINIGVLIMVKNVGAKTGAKNIDQLKPIREQLDDALLNWQPKGANDGIEFVTGRSVGFNDKVLYWMDFYKTTYTKRKLS